MPQTRRRTPLRRAGSGPERALLRATTSCCAGVSGRPRLSSVATALRAITEPLRSPMNTTRSSPTAPPRCRVGRRRAKPERKQRASRRVVGPDGGGRVPGPRQRQGVGLRNPAFLQRVGNELDQHRARSGIPAGADGPQVEPGANERQQVGTAAIGGGRTVVLSGALECTAQQHQAHAALDRTGGKPHRRARLHRRDAVPLEPEVRPGKHLSTRASERAVQPRRTAKKGIGLAPSVPSRRGRRGHQFHLGCPGGGVLEQRCQDPRRAPRPARRDCFTCHRECRVADRRPPPGQTPGRGPGTGRQEPAGR